MWCCAVVRVSLLERNMVKICKFAQVCFYLEMFLYLNFGVCHVLRMGFVLNFSLKNPKFNLVKNVTFLYKRLEQYGGSI